MKKSYFIVLILLVFSSACIEQPEDVVSINGLYAGGRLFGVVQNENGELQGGVVVHVTPGEYQYITDQNGAFETDVLVSGEYEIEMNKYPYKTAKEDIYMEDGKTIERLFILEER